jgi:hypothetical protein
VELATDRPDVLRTPGTVVVPEGASQVEFRIEALANSKLKEEAAAKITASLARSAAEATVVVKPGARAPSRSRRAIGR